ncbi:hypothetical protein LRN_0217 [Ligilactobacillus ruminis DPC 6832]|uniref:Uncharacterized protein n=1 Tax=Ligilactobacillus ruminis DPC 6832 TaxID=1402208 RepID=A0A837DWD0_9LACO|nr:hypothetical protein LRN_0217 [Ligilactobacillus ruminis DPC 6832]
MDCSKNVDYGQNGQKQLLVRNILEVSTSILRTNAPKRAYVRKFELNIGALPQK